MITPNDKNDSLQINNIERNELKILNKLGIKIKKLKNIIKKMKNKKVI